LSTIENGRRNSHRHRRRNWAAVLDIVRMSLHRRYQSDLLSPWFALDRYRLLRSPGSTVGIVSAGFSCYFWINHRLLCNAIITCAMWLSFAIRGKKHRTFCCISYSRVIVFCVRCLDLQWNFCVIMGSSCEIFVFGICLTLFDNVQN
jgi:hypothetical protein